MVSLEKVKDQEFKLVGNITFQEIPLLQKQAKLLWEEKALIIDIAQVNQVDTSMLALLLDWVRLAKQRNISITFINIPDYIQSLMEVSGIKPLLLPQA